MSSFTCRPDRYMNKSELEELFKEFNAATKDGQSTAATFSSLVNSVRQLSISAVMETREEMLWQYKDHAKELAALRQEQKDERGSLPRYLPGISETAATAGNQATLDMGTGAADSLGGTPLPAWVNLEQGISWPGNISTLRICSTDLYYRRDMTDWGNMNVNGWGLRLQFNVFRFQEPGTIQVFVIESTDDESRHRVVATMKESSRVGWRARTSFHAYRKPRPGTDLIWVATREDPERCIFVKGDKDVEMPGWEFKFQFWVPK